MKHSLLCALALIAFATSTSYADIVFTGAAGDGDIFNDANYVSIVGGTTSALVASDADPDGVIDFANGAGLATGIQEFGGIDVIFDAANITGAFPVPTTGGEEFNISNTIDNNLFVTGVTLDINTGGIAAGGGSATVTDGAVLTQFLNGVNLSLTNSSLTLRGGGDPIVGSSIDLLDTQSSLFFTAEVFDDGTGGDFETSHINDVTFQGNALVFGADPFLVEAGDNAVASAFNGTAGLQIQGVAAVPEPTSAGLLVLAGMSCILRRRRR